MSKVVATYLIIGAIIALSRQIYAYIGITRAKFGEREIRIFNSPKVVLLRLIDIIGDVLLWPLSVCFTIYTCTHQQFENDVLDGLEMLSKDKKDADE